MYLLGKSSLEYHRRSCPSHKSPLVLHLLLLLRLLVRHLTSLAAAQLEVLVGLNEALNVVHSMALLANNRLLILSFLHTTPFNP